MLRAAVLLLASALASSHALGRWEPIGPDGGPVISVAVDPTSATRMYALARYGDPLHRSDDGGSTWSPVAASPGCGEHLQVRSDGQVFVRCATAILRSRDRGGSWETFYRPPGTLQSLTTLHFDPASPWRASGAGYDFGAYAAFTPDDGRTWIRRFAGSGELIPFRFGFDPRITGRLVGPGTLVPSSGTRYPLEAYESFDGRRWSAIARIRPAGEDATPCFARAFGIDAHGAIVVADCGAFRSADGGRSWRASPFPLDRLAELAGDAARPGRWLAAAGTRAALSSDGGASWQALPDLPAGAAGIAFDATGASWAATWQGPFRHDGQGGAWTPRNAGLRARTLVSVHPRAGVPNVVLAALPAASSERAWQSADGGAHWTPWSIGGVHVVEVHEHASDARAAIATTVDGMLHASADGGASWTPLGSRRLGVDEQVGGTIGADPPGGRVYGLAERCISGGFTGCWFRSVAFVRSADGGRTWERLPATFGSAIHALAVSPVDTSVLVIASDALHVSTDGGTTWTPRLAETGLYPVPSRRDARRWYAFDPYRANAVRVTADAGATWTSGTAPFAGKPWALIADDVASDRLLALADDGAVRASDDHALTWRHVVARDPTLSLHPASARRAPDAASTLYAASAKGVVRLALDPRGAAAVATAYEFHHAALDHYFVTADPAEIAKLDDGTLAGWARTGQRFAVYAAGAGPAGAADVCRFYGRPEKGLDSHFYSASAQECAAVATRFADSWQLESPAVFAVHVPDATSGACPAGTRPVYRVYNRRADANHRYTTSLDTRNRMIEAGWMAEGNGPEAVVMCSPV